jgi:hypothetical protein
VKVVSNKTQGLGCLSLCILSGQPQGARSSSSLFEAGCRERYYEVNIDVRQIARCINSIGCEHFGVPLGRRALASKLRLVGMIEQVWKLLGL